MRGFEIAIDSDATRRRFRRETGSTVFKRAIEAATGRFPQRRAKRVIFRRAQRALSIAKQNNPARRPPLRSGPGLRLRVRVPAVRHHSSP